MSDKITKAKNSGKKGALKYILLLAVMFAAGYLSVSLLFGGGILTKKVSHQTDFDARVYDSEVEFFDGKSWHKAESLEKLKAHDPFSSAQTQRDADEVKSDTPSRSGGEVVVARPRTTTTTTTSTPSAPSGGGSAPSGGGGGGSTPTDEPEWSGDQL